MPKGIYKRSPEVLEMLKNRWAGIGRRRRTVRQLTSSQRSARIMNSIPRTDRQREASRISVIDKAAKVAWTLPRTPNQMMNPKRYITGFYDSPKNNCKIFFQSSYELKAYIRLENDCNVVKYERCTFSIPYSFRGRIRRYFPDILVEYATGRKEIIEVKPRNRINRPKVVAKFKALESYGLIHGLSCVFWTEADLRG